MSPGDDLAPGLLLAMPQLVDPNFRRTVVLLAAHGPNGAMGLIVNRILPATVDEVLEGLDIPWGGPAGMPVWQGGPVMPQSGWVLFEGTPGPTPEESIEVVPGIQLSASLDVLRRLAADPPRRFRLILGNAGWGEGQIEEEIVEGAWMSVPATMEILFETDPDRMWNAAYELLGVNPEIIVPGEGVQ